MKLVNPTDEEFNAAFAEKVAGWRRGEVERGQKRVKSHYLYSPDCDETSGRILTKPYAVVWKDGKIGGDMPKWTRSFDAVLPFLEQHSQSTHDRRGGEPEVFRIYSPANKDDVWSIQKVWMHHDGDIEEEVTKDKSLPRAAVIALLRAHGVEVEFTQ